MFMPSHDGFAIAQILLERADQFSPAIRGQRMPQHSGERQKLPLVVELVRNWADDGLALRQLQRLRAICALEHRVGLSNFSSASASIASTTPNRVRIAAASGISAAGSSRMSRS